MRGHVQAVYDLSYVYVTPASAAGGRGGQGRGEDRRRSEVDIGDGLDKKDGAKVDTDEQEPDGAGTVSGTGGKSARVPSLAELVGTRDLARAGYEFRIHVRR
jgi:hypothetical protein